MAMTRQSHVCRNLILASMLSVFTLQSYRVIAADLIPLPQPIVWLKLEGDLCDSGSAAIANCSNGSNTVFDTTTPVGSQGQCLLLVPSSDTDRQATITIPDHPQLNVDSFTLTCWIRPQSIGKANFGYSIYSRFADQQGIDVGVNFGAHQGQNAFPARMIVFINKSSVYTAAKFDDAPHITVGRDATWVFLALSYDAATSVATAYISGAEATDPLKSCGAATLPGQPGVPLPLTLPATIGLRHDAKRALDGGLDDWRLYNTVLPVSRIQAIRNEVLPHS